MPLLLARGRREMQGCRRPPRLQARHPDRGCRLWRRYPPSHRHSNRPPHPRRPRPPTLRRPRVAVTPTRDSPTVVARPVPTTADHRRPRHQGRRHPRHQRQGRRRQRRHREKSRCPKPQWRRAQRLGRPNRESRSEAEPVRLRVGPSPGRSGMPRTTAKGSTPPGGPARAGPDAARRNSDADDRGRSTARRARPRRPRKGRPQSRRSRRNRGRSCVAMIPSPPRSGPTVRPRPPHAELG